MRLIDADALRKEHCSGCSADIQQFCENDPVCASLIWVEDAPTIDAIPVVRCKDCEVPPEKWDKCPIYGGLVPSPDFFCAYGERK